MKVRPRFTTGAIVCALLGAGFILIVVAGRATLLVRPWFTPILVATGALILVLVGRGTPKLSPWAAVIILLPVAAAVSLTPTVVSRVSQGEADTSQLSSRIGDGSNPLLQGKSGDVTLLQILLANQSAGGVYLAGRPVTVEAMASGPRTLSRGVIVCCAADARTISVGESGVALPRKGGWVRVTGKLGARGQQTIVDATKVVPIPTPSQPFL